MLPKSPRDMTEAILRDACLQGWPESQTLDFKREIPGPDARARNEFLKDMCALANSDGGDLVYGISERNGAASSVVPILCDPADAVRTRLTQIADAGLEPRVNGIVIHEVPIAEGGYVLIVRVPASFDGPHRFRHDGHTRFVLRNGTVTSEMTYEQIRTAFDRSATLSERAREFRRERCITIDRGNGGRPLAVGPVAVVHVLPIAAMLGRASVDVGALHDGEYMQFAQTAPSWGNLTTRTLNLDGLVIHPSQPAGEAVVAFSQVFRNGCLESVRHIGHAREGNRIIPSTTLATLCAT